MTYSQKIARVFEIIDYILLIPAAFGVLLATILVLWAPVLTFIVWAIAAAGVTLMVGYFRHSRGRLPERKVSLLWLGTILYNCIPLFSGVYSVYANFMANEQRGNYYRNDTGWMFLLILTVWWAVASFAPFTALYKNFKDAQKYL